MRFLRESAVERVMRGHDDAARDQQGDVRRMSSLVLRPHATRRRRPPPSRSPPRACRRGGRRAARRAGGRSAPTPSSRCRTGALVPSLTGAQHPRPRRRSAAPSARVLERHRPAAARRPRRARSGREGVARPLRAGAGARAGSRPADPLAGPEDGAVPDRGGAGQLRAPASRPPTARSSSSRWRGATSSQEYEAAVRGGRRARRHRRSLDLQRRQRGARGRRRRRPATGCSSTSRADYASIAILRGAAPDLLPQPRRRQPTARSPISCIRPRCTTRIGCRAPASRACCCAARRRTRQPATSSRSRRSLEERLGTAGRDRRPARGRDADRSDHRGAGAARHARAARRPAAARRGDGRVIRDQPRRRGRSTTSARSTSGCSSLALVVAAATLFNVARILRYSRSDTELATPGVARRGAGRGASRRGAPAARQRRPEADRARVARRAAGQRPDRSPDVLLDRRCSTSSRRRCRPTSASRRPSADRSPSGASSLTIIARRPRRRRRAAVHGEPRGDRRVSRDRPAVRAHQRTRPARDGPRNGVRAATGRQGGRGRRRRNPEGRPGDAPRTPHLRREAPPRSPARRSHSWRTCSCMRSSCIRWPFDRPARPIAPPPRLSSGSPPNASCRWRAHWSPARRTRTRS